MLQTWAKSNGLEGDIKQLCQDEVIFNHCDYSLSRYIYNGFKLCKQFKETRKRAKKRHGLAQMKKIKTDCIGVELQKHPPDLFQVEFNFCESVIYGGRKIILVC